MKKYLALFDLDGTLFDTGDVNYCSYRDALKPFGVGLSRDYFVTHCNGRHYTEFLPEIMKDSSHIEEVHQEKKRAYAKNLRMARANDHLINMIRSLKKTGLSSSRRTIKSCLNSLWKRCLRRDGASGPAPSICMRMRSSAGTI